ncbi:MAG TPA: sarcosine oxidase subunit gamma family protein [Agriterribacter sp.]|nr:sarcosine oxidase subunit gamma family protein [Agriterribacter sp.]HRQ50763.1 sarcosine oxidase subunit gamma family protein [Agriterribacter sp.]
MITKESPLKGMNTGALSTVAIRELPGLHTIDLRVGPVSVARFAVTQTLGMELPAKIGQIQTTPIPGGGEAHILCFAPDWWLLVGFEDAEQKLAQLKDQYHFSAVDVSGQRTTIELEGPHVREVLAHLWEQDLREKNFPVGSVSQGLIAKAPVIVCHMAPLRYRVMVRSSFAVHVWKALADAAGEWL